MLPMKRSDNYLLVVIIIYQREHINSDGIHHNGIYVSGYNPYQIAEVLDMDIRSITRTSNESKREWVVK